MFNPPPFVVKTSLENQAKIIPFTAPIFSVKSTQATLVVEVVQGAGLEEMEIKMEAMEEGPEIEEN